MELIKLCPACGEKNPVSEVICRICMTNLSSVSPSDPNAVSEKKCEDEGAAKPGECNDNTLVAQCSVLTLLRSDGRAVPVSNGSELGRGGDYKTLFDDTKTVSRRHARIIRQEEKWLIEDLGSTNGTWLNGRRLETGRRYPLKGGDAISLSLSCELKVVAS